jgi:hypothetical protein
MVVPNLMTILFTFYFNVMSIGNMMTLFNERDFFPEHIQRKPDWVLNPV